MREKKLIFAVAAIGAPLFLSACTSPVKRPPQLLSSQPAVGDHWPPYHTATPQNNPPKEPHAKREYGENHT